MQRNLIVVAMFVLSVVSVMAVQRSTESAQTLIDLENKWANALMKSDVATLGDILANTYVDTDEEGHRTDRAGVLQALKSGDLKISSLQLSEMQVYPYMDAAVVTGSAVQKGSYKGQPSVGKVVFTDTFVRQRGKWKAVASHRSTVR
jgi:ketosteroid isomerase-like protein